MLVHDSKFVNLPVMSLQVGSELARISHAIINLRTLEVVAYELIGALLDQTPSLLLVSDIREVGPMGIIIDSVDELVSPSDVVRVKKIYEERFSLDNIKVIDERQRKVGRVVGYTLESSSFVIQQLRVKRPLIQSLGDTELLIHRSQITHIDYNKIVVKSAKIRQTQPIAQPAQTIENPFRKPQPTQPSTADSR